jgi:AraC-like DNA-binding protein
VSAPDQLYRERRPAAALAGHVACVWIQSVSPQSVVPYLHRTVPNGSVELSCAVGSLPRVSGPQTCAGVVELAPATTVVGIRFRPGAAAASIGVPASELLDRSVDLEALWGRAAVALGERIAAAPSAWDAAAVLEAEIAARIAAVRAPDPIVAEAVRRLLPWGAGEVATLPSSLFISERQLRRRFGEAVGLAPKAAQRILRFQGFLAIAHGREPSAGELAQLAADAGYADQSHLTRESLRLSGLTPRALLRESALRCAPTHDHRPSFGPLLRRRALRLGS